jgi:dolichyl-phosphate-mannose-protein mannosyltransferase
VSRFLFIWHPAEVVFDEVHFGKFVSAYYTGEYYFDIHPPLGKLLVAGFAKFFGFRPGFDFETIGEGYGDIPYIALRFLPNLAGALIPTALALMLIALGIPQEAAFLAGMLLVFDNALLVQSHFLLVDSFLILFGFLGLALFFRARNKGYRLKDIILASAVLALSFSIKWTGLAFFGLALGVMMWDVGVGGQPHSSRPTERPAKSAAALVSFYWAFARSLGARSRHFAWLLPQTPGRLVLAYRYGLVLLLFIGIAVTIYLSVFWIHFTLLPNSGPGDAYMTRDFRQKSFLAKTLELNIVMFTANQSIRTPHDYGSPAWSWPLMLRPVYYWVHDFEDGRVARIYLLGNPIVWWLSTFGLIAALFLWHPSTKSLVLGKPRPPEKKWILYAGYLMNLIPFFYVKRVMFLYHYLPALGFAVAIFAAWIFDALSRSQFARVVTALIVTALIAFIFFAPLSYGLPFSDSQFRMRIWMPSWQ